MNWPTQMAGTPAQNGNSAAGNNDFTRKAEDLARQMWGTPKGSDGAKGGPNMAYSAGGTPLPAQAANWTTPQAHDVTMRDSGQVPSSAAGNACLARDAANWPTPASRDHKGQNSAEHAAKGKGHLAQLPNFVAHCFTRPAPATSMPGPAPSTSQDIWRRLYRYVRSTHGRAVGVSRTRPSGTTRSLHRHPD
ncbi:hypothetical protein [uncultured Roseobacter sp.]|uniref:hypothetical protein n=1 Tax=uncultured Roseobacter sp. TaxID=114847 RepID=UPI0026363ACA|nr:hypothetical protein [uncultured Roseobacter sp.]